MGFLPAGVPAGFIIPPPQWGIGSIFVDRIAAGRVPASIIPLLTAGRGVAIPKPSGTGLRTVVVWNIILRFVGSLGAGSEISGDHQVFLGTEAAAVRSGPRWWMRAHGCSY